TVEVAAGVLADVARVSVEPAPAVTVAGLNVAVVPAGRPVADRVTVWAVPEATAVETVVVVDEPCVTVPEVGLSDREKSLVAGGVTVSAYDVVCVCEVPVPVTVTV